MSGSGDGATHEFAPAKVNLFLHVVGRRPDGYHELDSLAVFAGAGDDLAAVEADAITLTVRGSPGLSEGADNLVLRAAHGLAALTGERRGARLVLDKRLPVASGIGGGSADAAAALRLLCRLWGTTGCPTPQAASLAGLASSLGADVPVCLHGLPARMGGVGERLSAAPALPPFGLVLANPGVGVSTPAVFRARAGASFSPEAVLPSGWADAAAMATDLARLSNDLEAPALSLCAEIGTVLAALRTTPGCLLARMSGSGATCFGLFWDAAAAERAAGSLRREGWWCWGGNPGS
ncbi:MAG: 4-(cytidine 5'-diphospho)-2-C-methyl-D-erythritol kinase [Janthinobacterium lividum]